jgi:hypothetical protein
MQSGIIPCNATIGKDLPLMIVQVIKAKDAMGVSRDRICEAGIVVQALNYESQTTCAHLFLLE